MTEMEDRRPQPMLWIVAAVCVLLGAILGLIVQGDGVLALDQDITTWVQGLQGSAYEAVAHFGDQLGTTRVAVVLLIPVVALMVHRARWRDLIMVGFVIVLRLVAMALKGFFESPRPTEDLAVLFREFDGLGYPSGHAMTAAVAAAMLGWILIRNLRLRLAIPITVVLAVTAILTGYARIWFGAHWFTDVVGGALFGLAVVALSINLSAVTYDAILRYRSTQTASSPR